AHRLALAELLDGRDDPKVRHDLPRRPHRRRSGDRVTVGAIQDTISLSRGMASDPHEPPRVPAADYRPIERFWPYVDLPEQPTDEELAALDPELSEAL